MTQDYYPIDGPWHGKLAIAARPRGDDWLRDEIVAWRDAGFGLVVSLLSREEMQELGLEREAVLARELGVEYHSFPIPDRGVPPSKAKVDAIVSILRGGLESGKGALVHCRQGIGRSALVAASVLASSGFGLDQ